MPDVRLRRLAAIEHIEVQAVAVRGKLGPLTVWSTPHGYYGKHENKEAWSLLYAATHAPNA